MNRKNKLIISAICFVMFMGFTLVTAGIDDYKWVICDAVNLTTVDCDNFWIGLNFTDENFTIINITISNDTYLNETYETYYGYDNVSEGDFLNDILLNITSNITETHYNKTDLDERLTTLDNKIVNSPSNIDLNPYALKTELSSYVSAGYVSSEINQSLDNYSGMSSGWEWAIILNWIVTLGIITGIFILIRMD